MSGKRDSAVASDLLGLARLFAAALPSLRLVDDLVVLRPPERSDWQEWSGLRGESRRFLMPWEPSWSADSLTRTAFRRRLQRYVSDWRTDQGYSFFLFRRQDAPMSAATAPTHFPPP